VLALCLALPFTTHLSNAQPLDPTQTYTTGNIVVNTNSGGPSSWVNGVYQNSLTCWTWGNPGYCGPNAIVRPGNNINFSFGTTDLYQLQAIANILPNSGTGLVVKGFNFGFTAKNGNGWDDGRQDYLSAYVNFYKKDGSVAENYNYTAYTNHKYDWTNFNFSETFNKPYASQDLSNVRYGFVGRDNNFWAGPYGPEVYNVSFSLKYSVDPCSVDPMSSPTCPGYLAALAKLSPAPTPVSTTVTNEPTTTTSVVTTTNTSTTTIPDVIAAPVTTTSTTTVTAPVVSSSSSSTSSTPSATNPQPKVGEVTISGSPAKTPISTSQILSIVRSEQTRIGNLETSTAQQAVEQAQSAGDKAQQESLSISAATVSQSQASASAGMSMMNTNPQNTTGTNTTQNNSSGSIAINQIPGRTNASVTIKPPEFEMPVVQSSSKSQNSIYNLTTLTIIQNNTTEPVVPQIYYTINKNESLKFQNEEPVKMEGMKFTSTNPIFNIINSPPQTQGEMTESKSTSSVNSKVQDNDAAGGVKLSMLATEPKGFDVYGGILKDVSFYPPKDIYQNQKVIDNNRALRQLSSDRLHQEMVNQQYRN